MNAKGQAIFYYRSVEEFLLFSEQTVGCLVYPF